MNYNRMRELEQCDREIENRTVRTPSPYMTLYGIDSPSSNRPPCYFDFVKHWGESEERQRRKITGDIIFQLRGLKND